MEDERRAVLERVARGELTPAEAASLLEDMESAEPAGASPGPDPRDWTAGWEEQVPRPPQPPTTGDRVARVRVVRMVGTADIVGDPTVREAVAEGPHAARREADTLVIESQDESFDVPGFAFMWGARGRHRRYRPHPRFGWNDFQPLRVRVNPDLPLEVEAQAGKLRIRGVHGPIRATVQAGSTDISDFRSPLDLTVQAGSVNARGRLDHGASRIRCDAGGVRIHLEPGSSVRVSARAMLGKVVFDGDDSHGPWVVGTGQGTLDVDATMGTVRVVADR